MQKDTQKKAKILTIKSLNYAGIWSVLLILNSMLELDSARGCYFCTKFCMHRIAELHGPNGWYQQRQKQS